jgi:hypothetical protein
MIFWLAAGQGGGAILAGFTSNHNVFSTVSVNASHLGGANIEDLD